MLRRFRSFVILLATLAVLMTNATWAITTSAMAHSPLNAHSHSSTTAEHAAGQHSSHESKMRYQAVVDCSSASTSTCEGGHQSKDPAQSCCGTMACHAAIATTTSMVTVVAFARMIKPFPLEYGLKQQQLGRLDRPPRAVGA